MELSPFVDMTGRPQPAGQPYVHRSWEALLITGITCSASVRQHSNAGVHMALAPTPELTDDNAGGARPTSVQSGASRRFGGEPRETRRPSGATDMPPDLAQRDYDREGKHSVKV